MESETKEVLTRDLDQSWQGCTLKSRNRPGGTAGLCQSYQVGLHCFLVFESRESLPQDLCCSGVRRHRDPVVHPLAITTSRDDAGAPKICQMPGDLRLRTAQDLNEVADADLLISHQVKDSEPGLIAQSLEEALQIELRSLCHNDIFALTDLRVKHIFVVADMYCGGRQCQSSCWIQ